MPDFGASLRPLWTLDSGVRFLNHGSYGATPCRLLAAQGAWRARMEAQPVRFMAELPTLLREAASACAGYLGASPDRFVFVENATAGVNAVARSLAFAPGDEMLTTDHVYGAVHQTLRHVAAVTGARVIEAPVGLPLKSPGQVIDAVRSRLGGRTKLVVIDHIASPSAIVFPAGDIVAICRARGVPVLLDSAHAPGQIDFWADALGADWCVGNFHKWLCAPKGAGFLVAADRDLPAIHPPVISHGYGQGLAPEFDWIGTRDPSAWLCAPEACAFHEDLGGTSLRSRNHQLVVDAASAIADECATDLAAPASMFGSMASIRLPSGPPADLPTALRIHDELLERHRIEAPLVPFGGSLWLRISAFAYNEPADYVDVAKALREIVARIAAD